MRGSFWIRVGAINGALAVAFGAFGAHYFKPIVLRLHPDLTAGRTAELLAIFETGVRYHLAHSLALTLVGLLFAVVARGGKALTLAARSFLVGMLFFSGSLYALSLSNVPILGIITPLGGIALIVGWVALANISPVLPPASI